MSFRLLSKWREETEATSSGVTLDSSQSDGTTLSSGLRSLASGYGLKRKIMQTEDSALPKNLTSSSSSSQVFSSLFSSEEPRLHRKMGYRGKDTELDNKHTPHVEVKESQSLDQATSSTQAQKEKKTTPQAPLFRAPSSLKYMHQTGPLADYGSSMDEDTKHTPLVTVESDTEHKAGSFCRKYSTKRLAVHPVAYDVVQGAMHGTLQAIAVSAALNPIDKFHTGAVLHNWNLLELSTWANVGNKPYQGALQSLNANVLRFPIVYTVLPVVKDELKQQGLSPTASNIVAGISAGVVEARLTAENTAIRVNGWKNPKLGIHEAWAQLPLTQQRNAIRAAVLWGAAKQVPYWVIMPIMAEQLYSLVSDKKASRLENEFEIAATGFVASAFATVVSYPLDRLQKCGIANPSQSQLKVMQQIVRDQGVKQVVKIAYQGVPIPIVRMGFAGALFAVTKQASVFLADQGLEKEEVVSHRKKSTM